MIISSLSTSIASLKNSGLAKDDSNLFDENP
jgi:hypothetical protein